MYVTQSLQHTASTLGYHYQWIGHIDIHYVLITRTLHIGIDLTSLFAARLSRESSSGMAKRLMLDVK